MRDRHDLPCPMCGGSTSCSFYPLTTPHLYCHKCEQSKYNLTEEEIELYTHMESNLIKLQSHLTESKGNNLNLDRTGLFPQHGVIRDLTNRNIRKDIAEKFNIETLFDSDNEPYAYSFPSMKDNNLIAQKIKRFDKKMKWLYEGQNIPTDLQLFGQWLFPSGGKFLTITEGEEDCAAAYQMLKDASPSFEPAVISINNGAANAEKECKANWEYINSFENIILAFDGDEPGQKAAEKVCRLFDYKPKVLLFSDIKKVSEKDESGVERTKWENKDANDYLKNKKEKDFVRMWWKAEKLNPKGVLSFKSLWDAMTKKDQDIVVSYPWPGLEKKLQGLRTGRFVIVKAPPKIGKTQVLRELVYQVRSASEHNSGVIFLEDTKKSIGLGMCAIHMNKPIQFPNIPIDLDELEKAHEFLSEGERITIFDPEVERTVENIMNKIMYFVKVHNCKFIFLDHISMLTYTSGDNDERRFLDKLVADLKTLTNKLNICIVAIIHVNDDGKTRGSRAPVQLCDALINLDRDKLNSDPIIANTLNVIVEENRLTGDSGLACKLFFDRTTGRLMEMDTTEEHIDRKVDFDD
jgi:twinkle protein